MERVLLVLTCALLAGGERVEVAGERILLHNVPAMVAWLTTNRGELRVGEAIRDAIAECRPGRLFLDVGANIGAYGIAAAARGCDTVMFEPQPRCQSYVREAIAANHVGQRARLVPNPIGTPGRTLGVPADLECEGIYPNNVLRHGEGVAALRSKRGFEEVAFVNLTDHVPRGADVAFLKVDVEGAEIDVLTQALPLFRTKQIRAATIEVSPYLWKWRPLNYAVMAHRVANALRDICEMGYVAAVLARTQDQDVPKISCAQLHRHVSTCKLPQQDVHFRLP